MNPQSEYVNSKLQLVATDRKIPHSFLPKIYLDALLAVEIQIPPYFTKCTDHQITFHLCRTPRGKHVTCPHQAACRWRISGAVWVGRLYCTFGWAFSSEVKLMDLFAGMIIGIALGHMIHTHSNCHLSDSAIEWPPADTCSHIFQPKLEISQAADEISKS